MKYVKTSELPDYMRRCLPSGYRKRKVRIVENCDAVSVGMNGYRDGGSVSYFAHYVANGSVERPVKRYSWPKFEDRSIELLPGEFVVESGQFCGKTATATFHLPGEFK